MDRIEFHVNGVEISVGGEVSSTTTLLQFLREHLELRGTKYMCLEAGCGVCIVSVEKYPNSLPEAVNSCMVSITSCDGWKITTIEGLGNRWKGYHPLQKALAENNGSQCGYCSPAFVMSMYSLLKSQKNLTMLDIERNLSSNICRCTGYRPILDAFKKFASDAPKPVVLDIEDITLCNKSGNIPSENVCEDSDWCFVTKENLENNIFHIELKDGRQWYKANSISDIYKIFKKHSRDSYMLVAGNTGKGVRHIEEYPQILIDISTIQELRGHILDQNLTIGAGTTLTELIKILKDASDTEYFNYVKIIVDHLELVAHVAVRNLGTIAGNLMLKHMYRDFPSDLYLLLQATGSEVTIVCAPGIDKRVTMKKFLQENMKRKVLKNILLPPFDDQKKLVTFKVSARQRNAHAHVNAAFCYKLESNNIVTKARIVYGGLSSNFTRARNTEDILVGKVLFCNETLKTAITVLSKELIVDESPPEPSVQYRRKLAIGLFYKGLLRLCPKNKLALKYRSGAVKFVETRPVSKGSQNFVTDSSVWPLNHPVTKIEAYIQCAGEAVYTEDIPAIPKQVFATFVLTTIGKGTIESINPTEALAHPGVLAFYSAKDIPGTNSFTPPEAPNSSANEEILCNGEVCYFNQPLGIIVAETYHIANKAALLVKVTYSKITKPDIDVRINKSNAQKTTLFKSTNATSRGKDIAKVIKGEENIFGQYHFCLENLVCVAWPTDDGLKVNPSSQYIDADQVMISRCLDIDQNSIDVKALRIGASYGVKISRQTLVATACCIAVYKLKRPCRFLLPFRIQTRAIGKRMSSSTNYEIGVDNRGVIQFLNYDIYDDNGYIVNELLVRLTTDSYHNCYKKDTWNFRCFNTLTDTASNTWFRSPGTLETINSTEVMMDRIAYELGIDPLEVRLNNTDEEHYPGILEMINTIKINSNYTERKENVEKYNSNNRWKKRGLRLSLMKWQSVTPFQMNITVSVYHGDGSVAITHGGVEIGQGINTKAIQVCAYFLNIPLSKIKTKATNTMSNANNSHTAASLTTQYVTLGVQRSCKQLLQRLAPLRAEMGNPTWEELIARAYKLGMNLQANGDIGANDLFKYNIYGVTLAEVEVDILTGEWQLRQVDLIEDVGKSVNQAIDVGQIEGAFIQGLGYQTMEELKYNPDTGELLTDRTWNYMVPLATDIPTIFNVYFRDKSYSYDAILGSKASSEPAICTAVVVPLAMREAIVSARSEVGLPANEWFQIDGPFTVEKICLACETSVDDFKFN